MKYLQIILFFLLTGVIVAQPSVTRIDMSSGIEECTQNGVPIRFGGIAVEGCFVMTDVLGQQVYVRQSHFENGDSIIEAYTLVTDDLDTLHRSAFLVGSGGGPDLHFAKDDLTFTGNRLHDVAGFNMTLSDIDNLELIGATATATLRFYESTLFGPTNWVSLQSPLSLGSDVTLTLPATDGTPGQVMTTDGTGVLSFTDDANDIIHIGNTNLTTTDFTRYLTTLQQLIIRSNVNNNNSLQINPEGGTYAFRHEDADVFTEMISTIARVQLSLVSDDGAGDQAELLFSRDGGAGGSTTAKFSFQQNDSDDFVIQRTKIGSLAFDEFIEISGQDDSIYINTNIFIPDVLILDNTLDSVLVRDEFGQIKIRSAGSLGGGGADDWGSQVVESDASLTGTGILGNLLSVDDSQITITESQISDLDHYTTADFTVDFAAESLGNLSDVVLTAPSNTEVLTYNGTNWVNLPSASGADKLGTSFTTELVILGDGTTSGQTDAGFWYDISLGRLYVDQTLRVGAGIGAGNAAILLGRDRSAAGAASLYFHNSGPAPADASITKANATADMIFENAQGSFNWTSGGTQFMALESDGQLRLNEYTGAFKVDNTPDAFLSFDNTGLVYWTDADQFTITESQISDLDHDELGFAFPVDELIRGDGTSGGTSSPLLTYSTGGEALSLDDRYFIMDDASDGNHVFQIDNQIDETSLTFNASGNTTTNILRLGMDFDAAESNYVLLSPSVGGVGFVGAVIMGDIGSARHQFVVEGSGVAKTYLAGDGQDVGIGNTNPAASLDITGDVRLRTAPTIANTETEFIVRETTNGELQVREFSTFTVTESQITDLDHYTTADFTIDFAAESIDNLSDVILTTPLVANQVLKWNGTEWSDGFDDHILSTNLTQAASRTHDLNSNDLTFNEIDQIKFQDIVSGGRANVEIRGEDAVFLVLESGNSGANSIIFDKGGVFGTYSSEWYMGQSVLGGADLYINKGPSNKFIQFYYTAELIEFGHDIVLEAVPTTDNANDNVLVRNSTDGTVELRSAATIGGVGASNLGDLADVTLTAPALDQVLTYNGTIWINQAVAGDDWGTDVVNSDISLTGDGTGGSPLSVDDAQISITESQISDLTHTTDTHIGTGNLSSAADRTHDWNNNKLIFTEMDELQVRNDPANVNFAIGSDGSNAFMILETDKIDGNAIIFDKDGVIGTRTDEWYLGQIVLNSSDFVLRYSTTDVAIRVDDANFDIRLYNTVELVDHPALDNTADSVLVRDFATGEIRVRSAATIGGGGSSTLAGLSDVTLTAPALDQVLTYNGSIWVNQAVGSSTNMSNANLTSTGSYAVDLGANTWDLDFTNGTDYTFNNVDFTIAGGSNFDLNVGSDVGDAYITVDGFTGNDAYIRYQTNGIGTWSQGVDDAINTNWRIYNESLATTAWSIALADNITTFNADINTGGNSIVSTGGNTIFIDPSNALLEIDGDTELTGDGRLLWLNSDATTAYASSFRLTGESNVDTWRGLYMQYDAAGNAAVIGVHDTGDKLLGSDIPIMTMNRLGTTVDFSDADYTFGTVAEGFSFDPSDADYDLASALQSVNFNLTATGATHDAYILLESDLADDAHIGFLKGVEGFNIGMLGDDDLYITETTRGTIMRMDADVGTTIFSYDVETVDEVYGVGWDASLEVPTKNALYDKIETLGGDPAYVDLTGGTANRVMYFNATATADVDAGLTFTESTNAFTVGEGASSTVSFFPNSGLYYFSSTSATQLVEISSTTDDAHLVLNSGSGAGDEVSLTFDRDAGGAAVFPWVFRMEDSPANDLFLIGNGETFIQFEDAGSVIFGKQAYFSTATLTDAASITWDVEEAQTAKVTLTANRTLANPTNMANGGHYTLTIIQDGGGTNTLAYGANYKFPGGTAPTLSTGGNDVDVMTCVSDGTNMYCNLLNDYN